MSEIGNMLQKCLNVPDVNRFSLLLAQSFGTNIRLMTSLGHEAPFVNDERFSTFSFATHVIHACSNTYSVKLRTILLNLTEGSSSEGWYPVSR